MDARYVLLTFLLGSLAISVPAPTAERQTEEGRERDRKVEGKKDVKEGQYSDRDRRASWGKEKEALERALKPGEGKDFYRRELEKMGYTITAVNYDKPDYIEYEIVKGNNTYEVQIDFDKNSGKATKVDVDANMWKADATKQVLAKKKAVAKAAKGDARYSDRDHRTDWGKGKEALERSLKPGEDKAFYRQELEKQGYKITSVNYDKPDYVEYEVVKGDQSYEVQIDLDKNTGKAKKVDVTTNMWQAEATERALEANRGVKTSKR